MTIVRSSSHPSFIAPGYDFVHLTTMKQSTYALFTEVSLRQVGAHVTRANTERPCCGKTSRGELCAPPHPLCRGLEVVNLVCVYSYIYAI